MIKISFDMKNLIFKILKIIHEKMIKLVTKRTLILIQSTYSHTDHDKSVKSSRSLKRAYFSTALNFLHELKRISFFTPAIKRASKLSNKILDVKR